MGSPLTRLAQLAMNLGCARRATGGWRALGRQLAREFASARTGDRIGGWRRAYGALIGFVAIGGRNRDRWYRRWIARTETPDHGRPSKLVLAASFADPHHRQFDLLLARIAACAGNGLVFVDAHAPGAEAVVAALARKGISAIPTQGDFSLAALPDDCPGLVILRPYSCPNPRSLGALASALEQGADLVYGDADEIDARGRRRRPRFKPGFSLDLFFHDDFLSDCFAISRHLLERVDSWNFDDPHGTLLRWLPHAGRVAHLPLILSHSLRPPEAPSQPTALLESCLRARYGEASRVEPAVPAHPSSTRWRCRFGTDPRAKITVAIPTRDRLDLLAPCVDSVYGKNDPDGFELLVVDNGSAESATRDWLTRMAASRSGFRVIAADGDFNWSWLNNLALANGIGDVFVFLNNDTVSITAGWLKRLAEYALRADAGAVGPLLLYPDGNIQNAGLIVGDGDVADQLYRGTGPAFADHAFVSPLLPRNVSAVTGACMAISRRTIDTVGTFDERFPIAGDVEYCLRAHAQGLSNIFAADVALYHHESKSRGRCVPAEDLGRLARLVDDQMPRDPFYNPNLAGIAGVGRGGGDFALLHEDTTRVHLHRARTHADSAQAANP